MTIEGNAFSDPRYELLGQLVGYNRHEALGRMALVYSLCTDKETDVLDAVTVMACVGPNGDLAVVSADLGETVSDGIRIKGAIGRIEWLAELRRRAAAGGKKRATKAKRDDAGRLLTSQPGASRALGHQPAGSQPGAWIKHAPQPEPSRALGGRLDETQPGASREPAETQPEPSPNTNTKKILDPRSSDHDLKIEHDREIEEEDLERENSENKETLSSKLDVDGRSADVVRSVFDHYRIYHPRAHPTPKSTQKEWRLIIARLREGYQDTDLWKSIDGYHRSPFHLGENDRQKAFLGLELIMRDSSHVQQGIELLERAKNPPPVMTAREMKGSRAGQQWLERMAALDAAKKGGGA